MIDGSKTFTLNGVSEGTATITIATYIDAYDETTLTIKEEQTIVVTVEAISYTTSFTLSKTSSNMIVGDTDTFTITSLVEKTKLFCIVSSDKNIVEVPDSPTTIGDDGFMYDGIMIDGSKTLTLNAVSEGSATIIIQTYTGYNNGALVAIKDEKTIEVTVKASNNDDNVSIYKLPYVGNKNFILMLSLIGLIIISVYCIVKYRNLKI